jgi:hypothetical protein
MIGIFEVGFWTILLALSATTIVPAFIGLWSRSLAAVAANVAVVVGLSAMVLLAGGQPSSGVLFAALFGVAAALAAYGIKKGLDSLRLLLRGKGRQIADRTGTP